MDSNGVVLVAPYSREFRCLGPHERARHAPVAVALSEGRGRCPACGLTMRPNHEEPPL
jgi:hypothetical protein